MAFSFKQILEYKAMAEVMDDDDVNESTRMIDPKKSGKDIVEQDKNKIPSNQELAMIRTHLASERTFLASTRTNAIFAGLSLLLSNNGEYIPAMTILLLCILCGIITTYFFYHSSYKSPHLNGIKDISLHLGSPMFYSIQLMAVLVILLYITVEGYKGKKVD